MKSLTVAFASLAVACSGPIDRLAPGNAALARSRADTLFSALAARVTDPLRDPKYDAARIKIANAAFLPSRVWNDTSVWSSSTPSRRSLFISGHFADGHYRLSATTAAVAPAHFADARHVIALSRLADDEYSWDTDVSYNLGTLRAEDVGELVIGLVAGAEGRVEREIRADYTAAFPTVTHALGQLFAVDSIKTSALPDGSTLATFAVHLTPSGVEDRYPHFARYLRRYGETARIHMNLTDHAGVPYFDASLVNGRALLRVRTLRGRMVAIAGVAHPIPDSLMLNGELAMKVRLFTVGFRDYHAEFTVTRTARERAWSIVTRREPQWVLPLITEKLLKTPLRRPFDGSGTLFRIGVHDDSAGAPTLLQRRMHLEVQESTILRFLGRLGAIAMSDYSGDAEREQYAWLEEVFSGLLADLRRLR